MPRHVTLLHARAHSRARVYCTRHIHVTTERAVVHTPSPFYSESVGEEMEREMYAAEMERIHGWTSRGSGHRYWTDPKVYLRAYTVFRRIEAHINLRA